MTASDTVLPPDAADLSDSALKRIGDFRAQFLAHDQVVRIQEQLERLHRFGCAAADAKRAGKSMLLIGESGSGKTALLLDWAASHPPRVEPLADIYEVLYVETPTAATIKALAHEILRVLGAPQSRSMTEHDLVARVKFQLREQRVRTLILDEANHLVSRRGRFIAYEAADFIKGLLNAGVCSVVLSGTPDAAVIYRENIQLQRRSMCSSRLLRYSWTDQEQRTNFKALLKALEDTLPFTHPCDLANDATAIRLHYLSDGCFGRAVEIIANAVTLALERCQDGMGDLELSEATENCRDYEDPDWFNPFHCDDETLASAQGMQFHGGRVTRLNKGKNKNEKLAA